MVDVAVGCFLQSGNDDLRDRDYLASLGVATTASRFRRLGYGVRIARLCLRLLRAGARLELSVLSDGCAGVAHNGLCLEHGWPIARASFQVARNRGAGCGVRSWQSVVQCAGVCWADRRG